MHKFAVEKEEKEGKNVNPEYMQPLIQRQLTSYIGVNAPVHGEAGGEAERVIIMCE